MLNKSAVPKSIPKWEQMTPMHSPVPLTAARNHVTSPMFLAAQEFLKRHGRDVSTYYTHSKHHVDGDDASDGDGWDSTKSDDGWDSTKSGDGQSSIESGDGWDSTKSNDGQSNIDVHPVKNETRHSPFACVSALAHMCDFR